MLSKAKYNYFPKVLLGIMFIWFLGGILIRIIEPNSFDNLKTSLWWAIVSMTTVGYGDYTPKTDLGRVLAVIIMLSGISLIAIVTATISSIFTQDLAGQIFTMFILTVAAAEEAIGLAIIVAYFRNKESIRVEDINSLKG